MTREEYLKLYEKYDAGLCNSEELELLHAYQDDFELLNLPWNPAMGEESVIKARSFPRIQKTRIFSILSAAAAILLLIGTGLFYFLHPAKEVKTTGMSIPHILPGGTQPTLTLSDGSVVTLDSLQNGTLAKQGNTTITSHHGQLTYEGADEKNNIVYNTINIPKGGQYALVLSDGTKVWINAASTLRFPVRFGNERIVELTGEAYFEVAQQPAHPFKVITGHKMNIDVLGTHFNVNAYVNEPKGIVSLMEGSVKVSDAQHTCILKPGQQAWADNDLRVADEMDEEQVLAWKNGQFQFANTSLEQVLRQLERWYNIEVSYNQLPAKHFYGTIPRNVELAQVLNMLTVTGGVTFSMEGHKLTVTNGK
ncbi:FecR family protein [[Flexibacter] sp. ATCC 35208]|uniref:FecR family protein n=1 Tax=[Flexibacter] sp. ATCC 35208 TaxID=1936242 RepID=UPI0009C4D443|nr:FecR family protein [[Flexibacter] sp. ATCC 35208]OMP77365.1 hypothetical protein BW716_20040 [[Flexibacter] sp. ATCC 35208]